MNTLVDVFAAIAPHLSGIEPRALYIRFPHIDKLGVPHIAALGVGSREQIFTAQTMADCVHQFLMSRETQP